MNNLIQKPESTVFSYHSNINPTLSVVVPVFKAERFVERCVRSLFSQDFDDVEFIFVDDCSPDKSIEIIKNVLEDFSVRKPFVKFIHHSINQGAFYTKHEGITLSQGKYVYVPDSDDWIESGTFRKYIEAAEQSGADIVYANHYVDYKWFEKPVESPDIDTRFMVNKDELMGDVLTVKIFQGMCFWINLFRKSLIDQAKIEIPDKKVFDDVYMVPILYHYAKKVHYADFYAYHYIKYNPISFTQTPYTSENCATEITYNYMYTFFKVNYPGYLPYINQLKAGYKICKLRNTKIKKDFIAIANICPDIDLNNYKQDFSLLKRLVYYFYCKRWYRLIPLIVFFANSLEKSAKNLHFALNVLKNLQH
jgi:glycosyltransferase involved in cell wall biosynthesis